tara:strand:- start:1804 stop:2376 length:573 start_codon:yes stop_codon:yes gene_type:complete
VSKLLKIVSLFIFFLALLNSCGIYRPVDSRKIPVNEAERVKKNIEEGRGIRLGTGLGKRGGDFQFASSNPMWRASLETLNFLPLANADYSGGIIISDWYSPDENKNESIKITIRFLSNEIRPDGIEVIIFNKKCKIYENCKVINSTGNIGNEIKLAIIKKAVEIERIDAKNRPVKRGIVLDSSGKIKQEN